MFSTVQREIAPFILNHFNVCARYCSLFRIVPFRKKIDTFFHKENSCRFAEIDTNESLFFLRHKISNLLSFSRPHIRRITICWEFSLCRRSFGPKNHRKCARLVTRKNKLYGFDIAKMGIRHCVILSCSRSFYTFASCTSRTDSGRPDANAFPYFFIPRCLFNPQNFFFFIVYGTRDGARRT